MLLRSSSRKITNQCDVFVIDDGVSYIPEYHIYKPCRVCLLSFLVIEYIRLPYFNCVMIV
jgi:hypothetical protein